METKCISQFWYGLFTSHGGIYQALYVCFCVFKIRFKFIIKYIRFIIQKQIITKSTTHFLSQFLGFFSDFFMSTHSLGNAKSKHCTKQHLTSATQCKMGNFNIKEQHSKPPTFLNITAHHKPPYRKVRVENFQCGLPKSDVAVVVVSSFVVFMVDVVMHICGKSVCR